MLSILGVTSISGILDLDGPFVGLVEGDLRDVPMYCMALQCGRRSRRIRRQRWRSADRRERPKRRGAVVVGGYRPDRGAERSP